MNPTASNPNPTAPKNPTAPRRRNPTSPNNTVPENLWDPASDASNLTIGQVATAYMSVYYTGWGGRPGGRDVSTKQRTTFWVNMLGADTPLTRVTSVQVRRVLKTLDLAGPTKNRFASGLSNLYRYATVEMEWEGENPARGFAKWPENPSRQVGLEDDQIEALLQSALRSSWPKMRLLILMGIVTGLRRSNIACLRYRDVDAEKGTVTVGRTKNGSPFTAALTGELVSEYRRFIEGADPEDLIFEGTKPGRPFIFDKEYRAVCARAGLSHINFHTLRHTCASIAARSGASTIEIMDLLNHRTPTMAARYSHLSIEHRKRRASEIFKDIGSQS